MIRFLTLLLAFGAALAAGPAAAQIPAAGDAFILVATAALNNSGYRRTVILSMAVSGDQHIGVILNRPSQRTLAELFPEHEPSKKVAEPVFFGGPISQQAIFALVQRAESPGRGTMRVTDGLYLAVTANAVDQVIEKTPQLARFYAGEVVWRPGELRNELGEGYWHVLEVDTELLFRKDTRALWDELSRLARAVRADAKPSGASRLPG